MRIKKNHHEISGILGRFFSDTVLPIVLILFIVNTHLAAVPPVSLSDSDKVLVDMGRASLDEALQIIWSGSGGDALLALEQSEKSFSQIDDTATRDYYLAQVKLHQGHLILYGTEKPRRKEKTMARELFEESMALAQNSIDTVESSDGYRVLADSGASWMMTKGLGGIISMAPKVQKWSDQALVIDPQNAFALLISTQGQINAPKAAGGDPAKAVLRLQKQIKRNDLSDIERFWTLITLAEAHDKLGESDEAKRRCKEASLIFPDSSMLEDCGD